MTDYKKLVEALRGMDNGDSCPCEYYMMCEDSDCVLIQAAAAIENLQDKVFELEEELNDADVAADDNARQVEKLAKRNAELHAELEKWVSAAEQAGEPKRGKWIHDVVTSGTTAGGVTYEHHYTCSVCGGLMGRKGDKFCYNCGAKMEVQE